MIRARAWKRFFRELDSCKRQMANVSPRGEVRCLRVFEPVIASSAAVNHAEALIQSTENEALVSSATKTWQEPGSGLDGAPAASASVEHTLGSIDVTGCSSIDRHGYLLVQRRSLSRTPLGER